MIPRDYAPNVPNGPLDDEDIDAHWHAPTILDCCSDDYGEAEEYVERWPFIARVAFILCAGALAWGAIFGTYCAAKSVAEAL